jgi:predicted unusual protein kinase regulating ubiquinone biosynthesis (AarF/ABC1/UbiB family)
MLKTCLLDFGLAKELPDGFGQTASRMLVAAISGDAAAAVAAAHELGFDLPRAEPGAVLAILGALMGGPIDDIDLRGLLGRSPIREIPSHFGLIARCMLLLNGLSHRLTPGDRVIQRAMLASL